MKKKPEFELLVLIEQRSDIFRAHCLDLDLAVSGANEEQAMVRLEKIILIHLQYAKENKSNPLHLADKEIVKRWFEPNSASPLKKSYILIIRFIQPLQRKGSPKKAVKRPRIERRYRESFEKLAYA